MVFADLIFLYLFLPLNLLLYYQSGNRNYRNAVLVLFSMFFYAWGEPVWIVLLIFTAFVDYLGGRLIAANRGTARAKAALAVSVLINLSLLGVFKYTGFLYETISSITGIALTPPGISLPIGISFYTFQAISYVVDVYRGDASEQKSYFKFLMYVSLYPQLVAGPIVRYKDIAAQVDGRKEGMEDFSAGITRFLFGLLKKTLVANTAGRLLASVMTGDGASTSVLGAWYGIILFALQIYYDFSAYSDMAIGLGRMFGFHFLENFDYPYISRSATEFWRRWHISLGTFFRDYLYIPLGGNRRRQYLNLLITWFATGLWHGASWNFVVWGLYYGFLIVLEKLFLGKALQKIPRLFSHLYLLVAMLAGWVFFYFTDLSAAFSFLGRMFGIGANGLLDLPTQITLTNNIFWLALAILFCMPVVPAFKSFVSKLDKTKQGIVGGLAIAANLSILLVATALLVGQSYNPFLYFRF